MASKETNLWSVIVTLCLFLLILFLLPTLVGGARDVQCNDRGFRNATDGLCTCISPFYGAGCEFSKLMKYTIDVNNFDRYSYNSI